MSSYEKEHTLACLRAWIDTQFSELRSNATLPLPPRDIEPELADQPDYSEPANWLCRPMRSDHCDVNLDATQITAAGDLIAEPFAGVATNPPIDCFYVYPADLDGSEGQLQAFLAAGDSGFSVETRRTQWVQDKPMPTTPFVTVPGLLTAACVYRNGFSYLSVTTHPKLEDPRTDSISGDVFVGDQRLEDWGLHLIDMNVAMGNLINIARQQGQAWLLKHG